MNPKLWGPHVWTSLIYIAAGLPDTKIPRASLDSYKRLINDLKELLPCPTCRDSFKQYVNSHPIPNNRTGIIEWLRNGYNHSTKGDVTLTWFINRHIDASIGVKLLVGPSVRSTGKKKRTLLVKVKR